VYLIGYLVTFSVAMGAGDAHIKLPAVLSFVVGAISFPFMYLMDTSYSLLRVGHSWFDGTILFFILMVMNAVFWGVLLAWAFRVVRHRNAA
jgi:hypothetical protein